MAKTRAQNKGPKDPGAKAIAEAIERIQAHPLLRHLLPVYGEVVHKTHDWDSTSPAWALVDDHGQVYIHATKRASADEWQWVIAHCYLHLGFGHLHPDNLKGNKFDPAFNAAACVTVNKFLAHLKVGRAPIIEPEEYPTQDEEAVFRRFRDDGIPEEFRNCGTWTAGPDIVHSADRESAQEITTNYTDRFAEGLRHAVTEAVAYASGEESEFSGGKRHRTAWQSALSWFVSSYPLLGAVAASFELIEDADICTRMDISIAAVNPSLQEIYVNPKSELTKPQRRFVIAHEFLHAGLRHDVRANGRDFWFWNIACDFVINGWLVEMGVGELPPTVLYEPSFKNMSAEAVYDVIVSDLRKYRKIATLRGTNACDVIPDRVAAASPGTDLDAFYRRALSQGLEVHLAQQRGFVPAGLVEDIRALAQPPMPWDVELAQWFDDRFPVLEAFRTYVRPSRRQGATPDIPVPSYRRPTIDVQTRTFGVVLDTSGSMDRALLGKALGAIASYAVSRDVAAVRVVFCDAAAHDAGYMSAEDIAGRVRVKGRGGTVLQPGIDMLRQATDFPDNGPILVITDGYCDAVSVPKRDHAFLIPAGARLPFIPRGPVFRIR